MQGAIHVARNGFKGEMLGHQQEAQPNMPVSSDLVRYAEFAVGNRPNFLVQDPNWAQDFAPNGKPRRYMTGNLVLTAQARSYHPET